MPARVDAGALECDDGLAVAAGEPQVAAQLRRGRAAGGRERGGELVVQLGAAGLRESS